MFALAISSELNILLALSVVIVVLGLVLKKLGQPYVVAYILSGVVLGPYGLEVVTDQEAVTQLGDIGLIVLMFFIGMHISLPDMVRQWKSIILSTAIQVLFSLLVMLAIGWFLNWNFNRILLLGFVISLSSSAVVIKLVESFGEHNGRLSKGIVGILICQDILIIPMIIIINLVGGKNASPLEITGQLAGGIAILLFVAYIYKKKSIKIPFEKTISKDTELQLFAALIMCFGFALMTSLIGLSAGLGALISGVIINNRPEGGDWLHNSLDSFRILLISIFFISIGMLMDLTFLFENWRIIGLMVLVVYITNHGINTVGLRLIGNSWKESILGGAMLAQIGEFSFILASIGFGMKMVSNYGYQLTIITIAITILISPVYVSLTNKLTGH